MKLKLILSITAIIGFGLNTQAQYAYDALRFSQTQAGSSARFKAIGNAQTGVGGDLSSLGGNPAGLGLFTRSELSTTFEINNYSSESRFLNKNNISSQDRININQAGAVFHLPTYRPKGSDLEKGWISFDLGLGYNRNADFGNNVIYSGTNPDNSIADYFAEIATQNFGNPSTLSNGSLERMAYDDYLIGYDAVGDYYFPETDINGVQTRKEERKGGQTQVNMAFAANYSNKFYLGFNVGLVRLNYFSEAQFTEKGYNVTEGSNYNLAFLQNQESKGKGYNAKFGFLYKLNQNIRLGASYETPTWYEIDDSYTEVLNTTHVKAGLENSNDAANYRFFYKLRSPSKLSGGIGLFLGKFGFISADVDRVDYSKIYFRGLDQTDISVIYDNNQQVINEFKKTYNYRFGAELKIENLMLRGGYGIQGNPYLNLPDAEYQTKTYSAGLGYRIKSYYLDFTYQQVEFNSEMRPYLLANGTEPLANVKTKRNNVFMTLGMRF